MNWKNLKDNQCPKCKNVLDIDLEDMETPMIYCENDECKFRIKKLKFDSVVTSIYRKELNAERGQTNRENFGDPFQKKTEEEIEREEQDEDAW